MIKRLFGCSLLLAVLLSAQDGFVPLFNGKNLDGWEIDTASAWSVHQGVIVGKTPGLKYNEFLRTKKNYADFVLKLSMRVIEGKGNSGVQFRSKPVPDSHEVSGYQADAGVSPQGFVYWGCLYDESRRKRLLAEAPEDWRAKFDLTAWHDYTITAQGKRIRIEVDGVKTVDYVEQDEGIEASGFIALQVHGANHPIEVHFKDLRIKVLP